MIDYKPKTSIKVNGNMTPEGATCVGILLSIAVLIFASCAGGALILWAMK